MRFLNRFLCATLTLCLLLTGAQAALSPALSHMEQMYRDGTPMTLHVSVQADVLAGLEGDALSAVQEMVNGLSACVSMQKQGDKDMYALRLDQGDDALLDVVQQATADHTLTWFGNSGNVYLTAEGEKDALSLLEGDEGTLVPDLPGAVRALWAALPDVYQLLEKGGAVVKDASASTSIKNVGTSPRYTNYTLDGDHLNTLWQELCAALDETVDALCLLDTAAAQEIRAMLRSLTFSSECRFKRMYGAGDQDLGLQFTGQAELDGDVRKVTLFGGWDAEKGFYVSLSLPAVKGENNLKWVLGGVMKQTDSRHTLTLEMTYSSKMEGKSASASLEGTLKNDLTPPDENLTGKLTFSRKQNGVNTTCTVVPALVFAKDEMSGTVDLDVKVAGQTRTALTAHVRLAQGENIVLDSASALDLRNMPEESQRAKLLDEQRHLTRAFLYWMGGLDDDARAKLTHALRTDSWMTGESVPLLEENISYWIVEEEVEE